MPRRNRTPPHYPFRHVSTCQSKQRFISRIAAQTAADDRILASPRLALSVYRCPFCSGWHLTNRLKPDTV